MSVNSFTDLNNYLKQFVPGSITDGDFYNPDNMYKLLPLIGSPHEKFKVVHVAGTSGKTSTCYYVAEILRTYGANVGLTVSPHIFEINERVQINGQAIGEQEMCELFSEFINTPGLIELEPTYFEVLIAFAFWVFAKKGCTHAIVEVGLGGLKDATNIIEDPDKVAVITDIGLDHTHILGDTIEKIAYQKAGIIKSGNQVFCYEQDEIVDNVIDKQVKSLAAHLHRLKQSELEKSTSFKIGLPEYQKRNWLLAREVASHVSSRDNLGTLSPDQLEQTQVLVIPARMQSVKVGNKILVFDGAHNPQKLETLIDSLKLAYPNKSFALLVAFMESKQSTLYDSLKLLSGIAGSIIVTEFFASTDLPHKVIPADKLKAECQKANFANVSEFSDANEAFDELLKQPQDILLITGSFYLIGSLRNKLKEYL